LNFGTDAPYFRLHQGVVEINQRSLLNVEFLYKEAEHNKTHITLIAGPNGSSKSRILASIVELLRARAKLADFEKLKGRTDKSAQALRWVELRTLGNSGPEQTSLEGPLPTRVLAISNIVMDRFPYTMGRREKDDFYFYLGSRQASNAVMIGAMGQSMADALIEILPDQTRYETFSRWIELALGRQCDLALDFERITRKEIETFLYREDQEKFMRERMERRAGSGRRVEISEEDVQRTTISTRRLFEFLLKNGEESFSVSGWSGYSSGTTIRLPLVDRETSSEFREALQSLSDISRAGYGPRPSVLVKINDWLSFNDLSSGEQNILSTGAKLVAYAAPACLIAIDEPEVSLNASWQQKYVELVLLSLEHAPGSHVIIATHSPHLVANLPREQASVIVVSRSEGQLAAATLDAAFEGWGTEAILYEVFDIPSASSFLLNREIAEVLLLVQDGGTDIERIDAFLNKISKIRTANIEPLEEIIRTIKEYREEIS
jgi:predicted ATPase